MLERLHKVMARAGVASRRKCEELILKGKVKVDGQVIRELGYKVDPEKNVIEVLGEVIDVKAPKKYLVLNKPKGYLTTMFDPFSRPTIKELLPEEKGVYPVGRLDFNSEGLLILTNDGEFAYRLTHPKFKIPKVYEVLVQGCPSFQDIWRLRMGINLEDGPTLPARVTIKQRLDRGCWLQITITEGRKRQVRRMCLAIGHPVIALKRIAIGPVKLAQLQAGEYRFLSEQEVNSLKAAVGLH
jgi:23S rRNA pseudouridine2605 synthase/16S rRNA pseudouridine516 synthase